MATALFPGSFDPFTTGHEAILRRVLPLFDKVVVAVGINSEKAGRDRSGANGAFGSDRSGANGALGRDRSGANGAFGSDRSGANVTFGGMFSVEERMKMIRERLADCPTVEVTSYEGMTIDLCHQLGAQVIIRGIRTAADFEYEQTIAAVNRLQDPSIETFLLLADPEHRDISSTLERERLTHSSNQTIKHSSNATN